jgi:hypothetical protein
LLLQIRRDGRHYTIIEVNEPPSISPPSSRPHTPLIFTPSEQLLTQTVEEMNTPLSVSAPKFHRQARKISGELVDSSFDPFEDELEPYSRRKRPRISWGSNTRYSMTEAIPSPEKDDDEIDAMVDELMATASRESELGRERQIDEQDEDDYRSGVQPSSPVFGGLLSSQKQLPAIAEFRVPATGPFTVFRDPPLFSRTTTTNSAPPFSFTSSAVLETQNTMSTVPSSQEADFYTAPSEPIQQLPWNKAATRATPEPQSSDVLEIPETPDVGIERIDSSPLFQTQAAQLSSHHEEMETFQSAQSSQTIRATQASMSSQQRQYILESPTLSFERDLGSDLHFAIPETYQGLSREELAGFSQDIEVGADFFGPSLGYDSVPLHPLGNLGPIATLPTYVRITSQAETLDTIPDFSSVLAQGSQRLVGPDYISYPDIQVHQPTQALPGIQEVLYPEITGLNERQEVPETQEIEDQFEIAASLRLQPVQEPPDSLHAGKYNHSESPTSPPVVAKPPEESSLTTTTTPPRWTRVVRNQLEFGQPSTQGVSHEIIEPFTPTASREIAHASSPVELSPALSQLLKRVTQSPASGLRTRTAYYTPLANLVSTLNRFSAYDNLVDVLVIVTRDSTRPLRAEKGPKDYFTKFRVSQPGFWPNTTLVSVFRPFKAALPSAQKGEVVLLRDFDGGSLKGGLVGLISNARSGWCVFKRAESEEDDGRRVREKSVGAEEARGPPVEFGDEERAEAERLMEWWEDLRR